MKLNEHNLKSNSGVKGSDQEADIPTRQLVRTHWGLMAWKNLKKVKILDLAQIDRPGSFGQPMNRSEYELVAGDVLASPELRSLHPQHKIPSALIDDVEIFESSAICEYLCDSLQETICSLRAAVESVLYILSGSL